MNIHFKSMGFTHHTFERPGSDIKKSGYLRKLKTMKKKFFVLRSTSSSGPARLEYYGSEKKFQAGTLPKRSIQLHTCFNINRRSDSRSGRWGIVLYTVQDSFAVVTETEEEQESWLAVMLEYQDEYLPEGSNEKEHYEHVWQVTMQPRGLGQGKGNKGPYRLCLNSSTVSLFKVNSTRPQFTFQLVTIKVVAHHENSFWLTLGNYASTGPGEFFFTVEGADTAKDIHTTILDYMSSVQDYFHGKNLQFVAHVCPRDAQTCIYDGFAGPLAQHSDSRKFHSVRSKYIEDSSQDFIKDSHMNHQKDLASPLCPTDLDGEVNAYTEFSKSDFASLMQHQGSHSSHPSSLHIHTFSELQFLTHLPTVKEGGSGEGYLLSDIPSSSTGSSELPRPEPATCLLSDDLAVLPPRTYSLGSKPVKKFQGYCEMGSRKGTDNEMSRATSAPHILKGRRERDHAGECQTPAVSPLSMSLKSDDSDSFAEFMPIRPRTASDSFNYRARTSSFGKLPQNCRPRSSSYGQGKRPVINMNKLRLEKAMMSQDPMQRISRESSLLSSFESLGVSRESLRRASQELRQPGMSNTDDTDLRSTPSPQMRNAPDQDAYMDLQLGAGKRKTSPHRVRSDSTSSGRSIVTKTRGSDHQRHQPCPQQINDYVNMAPLSSGGDSSDMQPYVNFEFGSRLSDIKQPLTIASQIQPSSHQDAVSGYRNADSAGYRNADSASCRNKRSATSRSVSMENVDTYIISDNKPRTGSCGSKDKNMLRPESMRRAAPSSSTSSSSGATHPWPVSSSISSGSTHQPSSLSGATHQQRPSPLVNSSGIPHNQPPHPLVSSSTRTFGSSDSIRKSSSMEKTVVLGRDFRKKSGSTGSRPTNTKASINLGKEQCVSGAAIMSSRKPSTARFSEEEPDYQFIEFSPASSRSDCPSSHGQVVYPHSALSHPSPSMMYTVRTGQYPSNESATTVHSNSVISPAETDGYVLYNPPTSSSAVSSHAHNYQQHQIITNNHYHSPHFVQPSSSSLLSQSKPISADDDRPGYITFDLKKALQSVPAHLRRNQKVSEAKDKHTGLKNQVLPCSAIPVISSESSSSKDVEEYVDYEPFPSSESHVFPSHIHKCIAGEAVGKPKLKQYMSLETATSVSKSHAPGMGSLFANQTFTCDSVHRSDNNFIVAQHLLPPVPPLPASAVAPKMVPSSLKESETPNPGSSVGTCHSQGNVSPDLVGSKGVPTTVHDTNSVSAGSAYTEVQNSGLHQARPTQSQNLQRQLSAPVYSSSPANQPAVCEPPVQADQTQPIDKPPCSSAGSDSGTSESCSKSCSTFGQSTKTSDSSHKSSSKLSPDPNNISCIESPPGLDIPVCIADDVSKPRSSSERQVLPPSTSPLSCAETSLSSAKCSEANTVPTKARTRHSLGDIMSIVGIDRWKRQGHKASNDVVSSSNPCYRDSLQPPMGPKSRHSLSDLDSCHNIFADGLAALSPKPCTTDGSCRAGGNNDAICGSTNGDQFPKSLNPF